MGHLRFYRYLEVILAREIRILADLKHIRSPLFSGISKGYQTASRDWPSKNVWNVIALILLLTSLMFSFVPTFSKLLGTKYFKHIQYETSNVEYINFVAFIFIFIYQITIYQHGSHCNS